MSTRNNSETGNDFPATAKAVFYAIGGALFLAGGFCLASMSPAVIGIGFMCSGIFLVCTAVLLQVLLQIRDKK